MDHFQLLLVGAQQIQQQRIARSTLTNYQNYIRIYEKEIADIEGAPPPFPITSNNIMVFLEKMRSKGSSFGYLKAFVAGLAHYFRENNMVDLTKTYEIYKYKEGLMRSMKGESCPNAKEPITPQMLNDISSIIDQTDRIQVRDMTMYAIMFYGFLRFRECAELKRDDIITEVDGKLRIIIRSSKTDKYGEGESIYILPTGKSYCAIKWLIQYIRICEIQSKLLNFNMSNTTFKRRLDRYLSQINIDKEMKCYAGHSFRRGGAHFASLHGVQDCNIKAHGRWKSAIYTKYTAVEMIDAGIRVSGAL